MELNKYKPIMVAGVISAFAFSPITALGQGAQFVSCPAPVAHCVHHVGGWREREANGKIMVIFRDKSMSSEIWQQCLAQARQKAQQKPAPKR